ncbi:MAG: hypothetical protein ICV73_17080 [Acetobacteraceae bacterium]|nr:hypothetical protein [Acetobacteraceae bacterium]
MTGRETDRNLLFRGAWTHGLAVASGLLLGFASLLPGGARARDLLPAVGAAATGTTVSGISPGAFTAVQFHVAFHGCEQGRERVEDLFPTGTGYLGWADYNRLIVLFPQVAAVPFSNPQGCWDFFAYGDPDHATHEGRRVSAAKRMLDRLQSPALR